jgi:formylglycine-generating enzyme required for sulfatase activity
VYPAYATWHEAVSYCNALSKNHGLSQCYECTGSQRDVMCSQAAPYSGSKLYDCPGFRLPTEAEWEYAYRAGTTSAYYDGTDPQDCGCCPPNLLAIAHYASSSVAPVGSKLPNGFGLHDMAANVEEWAADWLLADLGGKLVVDPFRDQPGEQEVDPLSGVGRPLRAVRNARYVAMSSGAIRAAMRWGLRPEKYVAGFRCVRTLNP